MATSGSSGSGIAWARMAAKANGSQHFASYPARSLSLRLPPLGIASNFNWGRALELPSLHAAGPVKGAGGTLP